MRKLFLSMLVFLSVFAVADARKVSGRVHCEGQNLSGVLVTDGTNFTVTKNNGTFKFEIEDNAKFVHDSALSAAQRLAETLTCHGCNTLEFILLQVS